MTNLWKASALILATFASGPHLEAGTITDLGTLGGAFSSASAISANGNVTGTAELANGAEHAFLYSGGGMRDLGTLGTQSSGLAVNSGGGVVGSSGNPATGSSSAFEFYNGSLSPMALNPPRYAPGAYVSEATAINEKGDVAGDVTGPALLNISHLFYYSAGSIQYWGIPGPVYASGLNNNGQIAMYYPNYPGTGNQSFIFQPALGGTFTPLGDLGGGSATAVAINDSGQVVGNSLASHGGDHAFLYSAGSMTDLDPQGVLPSSADAISADGHVVGDYEVNSLERYRAFLYFGGVMTDLNSFLPSNSGWTLTTATGVNDLGQIVGVGNIGGLQHAFLLQLSASEFSPSSSAAGAPEPGTWVLLLTGIPALALSRFAMATLAARSRP